MALYYVEPGYGWEHSEENVVVRGGSKRAQGWQKASLCTCLLRLLMD